LGSKNAEDILGSLTLFYYTEGVGEKVTKINSSSFGSITVNDVVYRHDIYMLPSGKVEQRSYGHTFKKDQVEYLLKENTDVVVIGKGTSGCASLSGDARALLQKKAIEIIEANTPDVVDKFNELKETKRVAAIVHVTC